MGKTAEEIEFSPKNKFKEIVTLYHRREEGADIEDTCQDKIAYAELYESAITKISDSAES
jgi:hypothetical protein